MSGHSAFRAAFAAQGRVELGCGFGFVCDAGTDAACRPVAGSFGSQGAAGSCRAPGAGGALGTYSRSGPGRARVRSVADDGRAAGRAAGRIGCAAQAGAATARSVERLLGLERLEGAQRAPELGHRRAAIAQQRLERARAVAVADQGEPEPAVSRCAAPRTARLRCGPPAPDATRRPRRAARARPAARRRAPAPRPAPPRAPANSAASSSGSTRCFCARMPCFSAFCADLALPSSVFGPRDFAPFLRLASARALLTGTAARGAAPALDMAGFLAGWGGGW